MLDTVITEDQYSALARFVAAISARDGRTLSAQFLVSEDIVDEIFEAVSDYYDEGVALTVPSPEVAAIPGGPRMLVEAYQTNYGTVIVECVMFADGVRGEAILHVEFVDDSDRLHYRYIGS